MHAHGLGQGLELDSLSLIKGMGTMKNTNLSQTHEPLTPRAQHVPIQAIFPTRPISGTVIYSI